MDSLRFAIWFFMALSHKSLRRRSGRSTRHVNAGCLLECFVPEGTLENSHGAPCRAGPSALPRNCLRAVLNRSTVAHHIVVSGR